MADRAEPAGERRWRLFLWLCAALAGDRVDWPEDPADTEPLIALADAHYITPTLAVALHAAAALPGPVRDYLGAVASLNRERNAHLLAGIEEAAACLAANGIPAVFLKGAAHLADGLYPDPAARFLGDVDLLVPRLAAPAAARALAGAGFSEVDGVVRRWVPLRHHHLPMQRHVDSGVGIEIHYELLNPAYQHLVSSKVALRTAVPAMARPDVFVPAARVRVLHAIVHDQLGHGWRRRRCGLRTLTDLSRLLARPDADADLANLTDDLPPSARHVVSHVLASAGLLGAPVDPEATRRAAVRLRRGIERPGLALSDTVMDGIRRLRFQPVAAVNLLDPLRWPERLDRLRSSTR